MLISPASKIVRLTENLTTVPQPIDSPIDCSANMSALAAQRSRSAVMTDTQRLREVGHAAGVGHLALMKSHFDAAPYLNRA